MVWRIFRIFTPAKKDNEENHDATGDLSVHFLTHEEVLNLLRNKMMQSLMVVSLLKNLSKEI